MLTNVGIHEMMLLVRRDLTGKDTMPRRNSRRIRPQAVKTGRNRKQSFWHTLADGLVTLDEQVTR